MRRGAPVLTRLDGKGAHDRLGRTTRAWSHSRRCRFRRGFGRDLRRAAARGDAIVFLPNGMSCGGAIFIGSGQQAFEIRVNWLTGAVEVRAARRRSDRRGRSRCGTAFSPFRHRTVVVSIGMRSYLPALGNFMHGGVPMKKTTEELLRAGRGRVLVAADGVVPPRRRCRSSVDRNPAAESQRDGEQLRDQPGRRIRRCRRAR